jgi:hypothetical protein
MSLTGQANQLLPKRIHTKPDDVLSQEYGHGKQTILEPRTKASYLCREPVATSNFNTKSSATRAYPQGVQLTKRLIMPLAGRVANA